ncbi:hypothetical protein [Massilia endophytica]|uniref:hypothetical protein n=1 Tax=Massilia endophytica TaxID=2899220 RepID=UPI001E2E7013|nr:hypothetical protein [Massilia endophytica]UGQ45277.1 hypothetical protein LSQ66_15950 [Massilia endophytica]
MLSRSGGLLAALVLHLLVLVFALRGVAPTPLSQLESLRSQIVWLKSPAPKPEKRPVSPAPISRRAPDKTIAASPVEPEKSATISEPARPAEPAEPQMNMEALVRQAGLIGKELSAKEKNVPNRDSFERKLARGLAEARDGVKPKWFEGARIELFSAPDDPRKIYKVTTAFGEYCVFYPDKSKSTPDSGQAYFGQPTMSSCPVRF